MKVPLLDLQAQYAPIRDELRLAVDRVFETQQFVMGPEVAALEAEVAAYCQTKEAIGCASGSDALLLSLMALNVGAGDEVITTPFSFFATGSAIARLGARPVFVDIDPFTYNLNVDHIAAAITSRTRVVLPVHLYGQCADMDQILPLCKSKNLIVLEDAAQAVARPAVAVGASQGCHPRAVAAARRAQRPGPHLRVLRGRGDDPGRF